MNSKIKNEKELNEKNWMKKIYIKWIKEINELTERN